MSLVVTTAPCPSRHTSVQSVACPARERVVTARERVRFAGCAAHCAPRAQVPGRWGMRPEQKSAPCCAPCPSGCRAAGLHLIVANLTGQALRLPPPKPNKGQLTGGCRSLACSPAIQLGAGDRNGQWRQDAGAPEDGRPGGGQRRRRRPGRQAGGHRWCVLLSSRRPRH